MKNRLKDALKRGEIVVGAFVGIVSREIVQIMGYCKFDFIVIDTEHGPMDIESTGSLITAAESTGIVPVVRVATNNQTRITQALDIGAQGIQIPEINDKKNALQAYRYSKFAPLGSRGLASSVRANGYGTGDLREYIRSTNGENLVIIQIESVDGLANLPEILTVEGIDVIFIGPVDLSQSLGIPGELANEKLLCAMDQIITQSRAAGKAVGTIVSNSEQSRRWIDLGAQYICIGSTGLILNACKDFVQDVKNVGGKT